MKNRQVTIRDLALKLNISISTVSRALRNAPDVNLETRKQVKELAEKLHYEPNKIARSLRIKNTKTIGVIVPEIALYFFSTAISGIQDAAAKSGYSIMICQSMESYETEIANLNMLVSNRVDCLMISLSGQTEDFEHLHTALEKEIPIILFDRSCDIENVSKVIVDDLDSAHKATSYLIESGCSKIAYLGGPENLHINRLRKQGYITALLEKNLCVREELIVQTNFNDEDVSSCIERLLGSGEKPDAILCFNDLIAIRVLVALKNRNINVPEEISVVGFTDEPISSLIDPSLTTVAQPAYEIGKKTFELFLEQIKNQGTWKPKTIVMPTQLIKRKSTKNPSA